MSVNTRALLAKIHLGVKQLGLDDDTYRQLLENLVGQRTCAGLSESRLAFIVNELERKGAVFTSAKTKSPKPKKDFYEINAGVRYESQKRYIAALWQKCGYKMSGLDTRVKKQFGCDKFLWLNDPDQLQTLSKDLYNRANKKGLNPSAEAFW